MIKINEVVRIGKLTKTHALKGEIEFAFDDDIFDHAECNYLILSVDGILVPFFIKEYRFKGKETALITFVDIDNSDKASKLQGLEVFFPKEYFEESQEQSAPSSWDFFIGFKVVDAQLGSIGTVVDVDTQTINTLFILNNNQNQELIIPAVEEFIQNIDAENKIIEMLLPEGLLD